MEKAQKPRGLEPFPEGLDEDAVKLLLGRWVQERRKEVGVSALELGQAAFAVYGVSLDGIRHIERGARKPTASQARAVIGILGLLEEHERFLKEYMRLDPDEGATWNSTPRTRVVPPRSSTRLLETYSLQLNVQIRVSPEEDALIRLGARALGVPLGTLAHAAMRWSLWEETPQDVMDLDGCTNLQDLGLSVHFSLTPRDLKRQREFGGIPAGPWLRHVLLRVLTDGTAKIFVENSQSGRREPTPPKFGTT